MMEREHPGKEILTIERAIRGHLGSVRGAFSLRFPASGKNLLVDPGAPPKEAAYLTVYALNYVSYGSTAGKMNSLRLPCPGVRRELLGAGFTVLRTHRRR